MDKYKVESERVVAALSELDPQSEEYKKAVENLKTLAEAENLHKGDTSKKLDVNTVLKAVAYIGGLMLTLKHEQFNVITSKAWSHLMRIF